MPVLQSLINTGTHFGKTPAIQRGIQLANAIALIYGAMSIVVAITYSIWFGIHPLTFLMPAAGLSLLVIIAFNSVGWTTLSRCWISLAPGILVTALSIYSKTEYYVDRHELDFFTFRIVILGSCVIPWIVFSFRERKALFVTNIFSLLIILSFDPLHTWAGVPYRGANLTVFNYYFANVVTFITFWMITSSLGFLRWISDTNEDRNIKLIDDLALANRILTERNAEIEAQSVEIQAQSDMVHSSQHRLLEANLLIEEQRKQLLNRAASLESELMENNQKLIDANSELIKHNNELRQFSYTVSHNLRGPVASLLGLIALVEKINIADEDRQIINHLTSASLQLDQIIRDLSKIIDIRHDIFKIRQRINLSDEITNIKEVLRREVEAHHVKVREDFASCPFIYSIKPMVTSILYNLVSNAIRYRSMERTPVVGIRSWEDDGFYLLEVEDNGMGIDLQHNRENVFRLYQRFHFHTEGKGLGLYLVKLQSELLGGAVNVESEVNRFTRFTVSLKKPLDIERQLLYHEDYADIFYDARLNATGVIWKREATGDDYRSVYLKCLEFFRSYNTPNYICNMCLEGLVAMKDQQWMLSAILPDTAAAGLRRIAIITHEHNPPPLMEYHARLRETFLALGVSVRFFTSSDEANEWLRSENERATLVSLEE